MDDRKLYSSWEVEGICLTLGVHYYGLEGEQVSSQGMEEAANKRQAQQIFFEFYSKPTQPKRIILASSPNPWQQNLQHIFRNS